MSLYQSDLPQPLFQQQISETFTAVMRRVYLWMTLGLFTTAAVAAVVANSPLFNTIGNNPIIFYGLIFGELALVMGISFGINKLAPETAVALFFLYAALNGLTLSYIFVIYTLGSVSLAFFSAGSLFGAMSIVGYTTKKDLTSFGSYLFMALIGLIIASVINIFWANNVLEWIVTLAGIAIFMGLTAYQTQRIKRLTTTALQQGDQQAVGRIGILGALGLYLDFINLFLMLLRITGRRR